MADLDTERSYGRWREARQPKVISNHPISSYGFTSPLSISPGTFSNLPCCPIRMGRFGLPFFTDATENWMKMMRK